MLRWFFETLNVKCSIINVEYQRSFAYYATSYLTASWWHLHSLQTTSFRYWTKTELYWYNNSHNSMSRNLLKMMPLAWYLPHMYRRILNWCISSWNRFKTYPDGIFQIIEGNFVNAHTFSSLWQQGTWNFYQIIKKWFQDSVIIGIETINVTTSDIIIVWECGYCSYCLC